MPLYEYECKSCGFKFEELLGKTDVPMIACKNCGKDAERQVSRFSSSIAGGSVNETMDMTIGREANARWKTISDRQFKRRGDKVLGEVPQPKTQDGKYMPVMALGDKVERSQKNEYVSALQDHRKKRVEKGQPQFDGPGSF